MLNRSIAWAVSLIVTICAVASPSHAEDAHCLFRCPTGDAESNIRLERTLYTAGYNVQTKFSDWVAYVVAKETLGDNKDRRFAADPDIASDDGLEPTDFEGAFGNNLKYEIGHQAPLNSLGDGKNWKELNYLSNVTPQKESVNSGVWRALESWEEKLIRVKGFTEVYVITGPLYLQAMKQMPHADEDHIVPSGYWKVLAVEEVEGFVFGAFIIPQSHKAGTKKICDYGRVSSIDEIELASGLDIFSGLPSSDEADVEEVKGGELLGIIGCDG